MRRKNKFATQVIVSLERKLYHLSVNFNCIYITFSLLQVSYDELSFLACLYTTICNWIHSKNHNNFSSFLNLFSMFKKYLDDIRVGSFCSAFAPWRLNVLGWSCSSSLGFHQFFIVSIFLHTLFFVDSSLHRFIPFFKMEIFKTNDPLSIWLKLLTISHKMKSWSELIKLFDSETSSTFSFKEYDRGSYLITFIHDINVKFISSTWLVLNNPS